VNQKKTMTHWCKPDELMTSEYGVVSYQVWCEKERDRINTRGDGVKIVRRDSDGFIALSR